MARQSTLLLAVAVVAAGCTSAGEDAGASAAQPEQLQVVAASESAADAEGATVVFDAPGDGLQPQLGVADDPGVDEQLRAATTSGPVTVDAAGDVAGAVTVRIPVDDAETNTDGQAPGTDADEQITVVWRDPTDAQASWLPLPTEVVDGYAVAVVDADDLRVGGGSDTAATQPLARPAGWTGGTHGDAVRHVAQRDWQRHFDATRSWLGYRISAAGYVVSAALGNRAQAPACDGSLPDWVAAVNAVDDRNAPLLVCAHADSGGAVRVRLTANRGTSLAVTLPAGATVAETGGTADVAQATAYGIHQQWSDTAFIPAGQTVDVLIDRPAELGEGVIERGGRPDPMSLAIDAALGVASYYQLPGADIVALWSCATDSLATSQVEALPVAEAASKVVGAVRSCAGEIAEQSGASSQALGELSAGLVALDVWDFTAAVADMAADYAGDLVYAGVTLAASAFSSGLGGGVASIDVRGERLLEYTMDDGSVLTGDPFADDGDIERVVYVASLVAAGDVDGDGVPEAITAHAEGVHSETLLLWRVTGAGADRRLETVEAEPYGLYVDRGQFYPGALVCRDDDGDGVWDLTIHWGSAGDGSGGLGGTYDWEIASETYQLVAGRLQLVDSQAGLLEDLTYDELAAQGQPVVDDCPLG